MRTHLTIDEKALQKAERALETIPGGMELALMRAYNRALTEGRTAGTRAVRAHYTLKARDVRETFVMHKAKRSSLEAELTSTGRHLPLSMYAHRPGRDTTGKNRQPVRVGVKKGGLKPLGQAFIHQGRVMQRLGASRLPVEHKYGPAVPLLVGNDEVAQTVVDTLSNAVDKRLSHETRRLLDKA